MSLVSRREFLEQSLFASAALGAGLPALGDAPRKTVGPNDKVRVAVVGVHGQGTVHVSRWASLPDVEIAAICDPDDNVVAAPIATAEKKTGKKPVHYKDLRKLLEDKSIDAISVATPNHWHCLAGIWAMQAGKDAYVEKPLGHNLFECRQLVEASRKYDRLCQMGNYPRSLGHIRDAVTFLREETLGKVKVARGVCYNTRGSIGKKPDGAVPAGVDYDLWLGPAPERPFNPNRFHYNWHWNWDFGGGEIANNGIYQLDTARWGIGKDVHPATVVSVGGRFGYEDDGQTPNTQVSLFDYGDVQIVQEIRGLPTDKYPPDLLMGNVFECERGKVVISIAGSAAYDAEGRKLRQFAGTGDHFKNFSDAVKSRKRSDLTSEVLDGHRSTALCHLANVSYRLGSAQPLGESGKPFGSSAAHEAHDRLVAHLKDNAVEVDKVQFHVGKPISLDPKTEKVPGDEAANKLLTREYRKPYVVPETV
ncbi:MAG TPA: Gfo/Idh/MocA family oxidoreductase [Planctomycetota bacterium]|nr:Gfo/Idh/MocA family oxidoreductase [Planctomycetota bacterium]